MPTQNAYWAKYGCELCDKYKLFVLKANFSSGDSRASVTNYITTYNCKMPVCISTEGGATFNTVLNNGDFGGPYYLIKPDKTFKQMPTVAEINTAGGNVQHVCATSIADNATVGKTRSAVSLCKVSRNGFALNVQTEGLFSIAFYSANGQLKSRVAPRYLSAGSHKVGLALNSGMYVAEINGGTMVAREKVLVK